MKEKSKKNPNKFNVWPYFKRHLGLVIVWLFLMIFNVGLVSFFSIYAGYILGTISAGNFDFAITQLLILLSLLLVNIIITHYTQKVYFLLSHKIKNDMTLDITAHAFKISDSAYTQHNTSNFTQRFSNDPSIIFEKIHLFIVDISSTAMGIIVILYIFFLSPIIGTIIISSIVLMSIFESIKIKIYKKNHRILKQKTERKNALLIEIVKSNRDIKSLNLESKLSANLTDTINEYANQDIKTHDDIRKFGTTRKTISSITQIFVLILGLWYVDLSLLTLASFMIIYSNRNQITLVPISLSRFSHLIADITLAIERINELYEDDEYKLEKFGNIELENIKGKIEFKNVTYGYPQFREKSQKEILDETKQNKKNKIKKSVSSVELVGKQEIFKKLNFCIEPNQTVAFVGTSGSGKSTILKLISKMCEADNGEVLIDNVNIQDLNKESLRNAISLVNQFPYIFNMSIKDNLLLVKENATDDEINNALKKADLLDFINTLPEKENSIVGESGIKLSGGQKQRLAIARALLKKSPIIIFDESTSSLDNISQNVIKDSINNLKGSSTIIIVAHRLSTIKNVDKIFFLENGELSDSGTFEELFNNNENFQNLFLAENLS